MSTETNLQGIHLPDHHRRILDSFMTVSHADEGIRAALLVGSHVSGRPDEFSDIDLICVVADDAFEAVLADVDGFVRRLGRPLLTCQFGHAVCTIYDDGAECDILFERLSAIDEIRCGPHMVLLDRTGTLTGEPFPPRSADPREQTEVLRRQLDGFWHELSHFVKAVGRGHLWFAYGELEAMRAMCVNLARLDHDFTDAGVGDEPYFKVERALPAAELAPMRSTYCPMECEAVLQAAHAILSFYRETAQVLARAHGLPYRTELEQIMLDRLSRLGDARARGESA